MIHKNKCEDGKDVPKEARIKDLNELKASYDDLNYDLSFEEFMIRSTLVRCVTFSKDMRYWNLWDKKEEVMAKHRRNRLRERDRMRALDRRLENVHKYRSRSRSRSRMRDILPDKSRDRNGDIDADEDKEHVK